jgi:hypothetical protein
VRNNFSKEHAVGITELQLFGENNQLLEVQPPSFVKGTISASSSLKPALAYGPGNLMDGKKDVAWSEGVKGNGIGETITFTSEETIWMTDIKIWKGYQRSSINKTMVKVMMKNRMKLLQMVIGN